MLLAKRFSDWGITVNKRALDRPADIRTLHRLKMMGLIDDEAYAAATRLLRTPSQCFDWIRLVLLSLGATLILAGIIFFFAYNWTAMGKFLKFGLIEASIIICVVVAQWQGLKNFSGKIMLVAASVLVGVLLAVYGQTYQTGADPFQLFLSWAMFILLWALIAESAPLWLIWVLLLNITVILYWKQVASPSERMSFDMMCLCVVIIDGLALYARERLFSKGIQWLSGSWIRPVLLLLIMTAFVCSLSFIILDDAGKTLSGGLSVFACLLFSGGSYGYFRYRMPDLKSLALIIFSAAVIVVVFIGRVLFSGSHHGNEAGLFLFYSLIIMSVAGGSAVWLKNLFTQMRPR